MSKVVKVEATFQDLTTSDLTTETQCHEDETNKRGNFWHNEAFYGGFPLYFGAFLEVSNTKY